MISQAHQTGPLKGSAVNIEAYRSLYHQRAKLFLVQKMEQLREDFSDSIFNYDGTYRIK